MIKIIYATNRELPERIRDILPDKVQTIYRETYNSAINGYDEKRADRIAWSVVKKYYEEARNIWVLKEGKISV